MASDVEYSWAAGFFDGEGTTSVLKAQRDKYAYIRMGISQKQLEPLEKFYGIVQKGKIYKSNTRIIYSWDCYREQDVEFVLSLLWPYLSDIKRKQAILAKEKVSSFRKEKNESRNY